MDSGETSRLTNLNKAPAGLAWSPDGKWISFAMHVPSPPRRIAEMPEPPEGATWSEPARGPTGMSSEEAVWSRDGRHLIVSAARRPDWEDDYVNTELWEFAVVDGAARALTSRAGPDGSPAVSPTASRSPI